MSRSGFTLPRLRQDALEAPGLASLPAVSEGATVANQVRDVLAAAGQAVYAIGRQQQIASAEEDSQNRGVAHLQAQKDLPRLGTQIEEDVLNLASAGDDIGDDALAALVESKIGSGLGAMTVNDAGLEQYRQDLTGQLTGVAFRARENAVLKARADSLADAASAFGTVGSAEGFDQVAASLKQIDPRLSEQDINARAIPALQVAARIGNRETVEAIGAKLGDTPEVLSAKWTLDQVEQSAREQAVTDRVKNAKEAFSAFVNDGNFPGAESVAKQSDIPEPIRTALLDEVRNRREQRHAENREAQTTNFYNTLSGLAVAGDTKGYEATVSRALASRLIEEADIPVLNAKYGVHMAKQMEGAAQVSVNALRRATTDEERVAAYQTIAETLAAADAALARPAGSAGRIEQDQYSEIVRIAEPVVEQMQKVDLQQQLAIKNLAESTGPTGADYRTVKFGDGTQWADVQQAALSADQQWQVIAASVADLPASEQRPEAMRQMFDWLSKNELAVWSEFEREQNGLVAMAFGAARNPDDPARLAAVRARLGDLAVAIQTNPEVVRRHAGENMELMEYMALVGDLVPPGNDELLMGALAGLINRDGPIKPYSLTPDDTDIIDDALKAAGFGDNIENIRQVREEAYAQAKAFASMGFRGSIDTIARNIGESYKSKWHKSDGYAIRVDYDPMGATLGQSYDIASQAAKGVWLQSNPGRSANELVLDKGPLGHYQLFERRGGRVLAVEGSPRWTGEDMRRIANAYRNAAWTINENKAVGKSLLSQARRDVGGDGLLSAMSGDDTIAGFPISVATAVSGAISDMVSNRMLSKRHKSWKEKFIQQNTRDLDEWEKYAVEMLGRNPSSDAEGPDLSAGVGFGAFN